ncbi:MAG: hypothetical protein NTZ69_05835 [Bacteroidia bacterium]|nr:hypothetical protein [Bacteroidia bacterium]
MKLLAFSYWLLADFYQWGYHSNLSTLRPFDRLRDRKLRDR